MDLKYAGLQISIFINLLIIVSALSLNAKPFSNYILALSIERQLKSNFWIPISRRPREKDDKTYNLLDDLIFSYTQTNNRILPLITEQIREAAQRSNTPSKPPESNHWQIAISDKKNKIKCSVQLNTPDSTVMARLVDASNNKRTNSPFTSIIVLNTLRRTNPKAIEMIYYKSNIPFDQLRSIASLRTLLIGALIEHSSLIHMLSYLTVGYLLFVSKTLAWDIFIKILTSRLFWHPTVYTIWCNLYYKASGPARMFTLKQIFDNVILLCNELYEYLLRATISLEGLLLERDIREYITSRHTKDNTIDIKPNEIFVTPKER